ncbi:MAG: HAD-IC family P-type ATPase, partial [Candidatus Chisholmbacteria bacterium]|nr:HAD-IC family P-type ATPase [Candidatus Chisholmbacteria bacterium]
MRVTKVISSTSRTGSTSSTGDEEMLVEAMAVTSEQQDPLEVGMWGWLTKEGKKPEQIRENHKRIDRLSFSPDWRYAAALTVDRVYVVGAPEEVIHKCELQDSELKIWHKKFRELGRRGHRLVGLAHRRSRPGEKKLERDDFDHELSWLGLVVYEDPVRDEVADSLKAARGAGMAVKVITGDYKETAMAVLGQLGIEVGEKEVLSGDELAALSEAELKKRVQEVILFVRTKPEQKLKIVQALQQRGEVVAMTGDGVNDAPAIKKADIGIVVGEASDVARETADMVLLDSNFKTILAAVEEGRGIFDNLRKVILYLLSDAFAEIILVTGSIIGRLPLPVTAVQILWVNLVDDGLPSLALTVEPKDDDLLRQRPRKVTTFVDKEMTWLIGLISGVSGGMCLLIFWWLRERGYAVEAARTVTFTALAISSLLYVFSSRSLRQPIWRERLTKNGWLLGAVLFGVGLQLVALYVPFFQGVLKTQGLTFAEWLVVLSVGGVVIVIIEIMKWIFWRRKGKAEGSLPKQR